MHNKTILSLAVAASLGLSAQAQAGYTPECNDDNFFNKAYNATKYCHDITAELAGAVSEANQHSDDADTAQNVVIGGNTTAAATAQSAADGAQASADANEGHLDTHHDEIYGAGVAHTSPSRIDTNEAGLAQEIVDRGQGDAATLAAAAALDLTDRTAQATRDGGQDAALSSEEQTRIANDRIVDGRAITRTAAEAQARLNGDNALGGRIDAEEQTRITNDRVVDSRAIARSAATLTSANQHSDAADSVQDGRLDANEQELVYLGDDVDQNTSEIWGENEEEGGESRIDRNEAKGAANMEAIAENSDDIETIGDEVYGPEGDENGESRIDRNEAAIADAEDARGSRDLDVDRTFAEHDQRIESNTAAIEQNSQRIDGLESDIGDLKGGVALGIAAAQHQFDYSYSGLQGSLALGHYETMNATSVSLGGAITERVFINGSVGYTLEGGQFGAGAAIGFKF